MRITIFVPISRPYRISPMIEQIKKLDKGIHEVDILLVVDNNTISVDSIQDEFQRKTGLTTRAFSTGNPPAGEINIATRRDRITKSFQKAQREMPLSTQLVFVIEDDTDIKPDHLRKLIAHYHLLSDTDPDKPRHVLYESNVGFVSGVQVGRWGFRYIGAWKIPNVQNMDEAETLPYMRGLQEVDAAGFYCFITSRSNFCTTQLYFGQFGPDVYFGVELRKKGLKNYVDFDIIAGHSISPGTSLVPNENCVVVKYERINNFWERTKP